MKLLIMNIGWQIAKIKNLNDCLAVMTVLHDLELIVFNVSDRQIDDITEISSEKIINSLETNAASIQNFILPLLPHLKKNSSAIITTGGGVGVNPEYHRATL